MWSPNNVETKGGLLPGDTGMPPALTGKAVDPVDVTSLELPPA